MQFLVKLVALSCAVYYIANSWDLSCAHVFVFHFALFYFLIPAASLRETPTKRGSVSSFRPNRVPEKIDVVVIGSGPSGLACSCLLAKQGKKVLLLEAHDRLGGGMHTFKLHGGHSFDSGFHYVGYSFLKMLKLFPTEEHDAVFEKLGQGACDSFFFPEDPENTFEFVSGEDNLQSALERKFPGEKKAISAWFKQVRTTQASAVFLFGAKLLPGWLSNLFWPIMTHFFERARWSWTTQQVLDALPTKNKTLKLWLSAHFADMGLPPQELAWVAQCACFNHYLDGGYYPTGGPSAVVQQLSEYFVSKSGVALTRAKVNSIFVSNNQVTGISVLHQNGVLTSINCKNVVSCIGSHNTCALVEGSSSSLLSVPIRPSVSHVQAFLLLGEIPDGEVLPSHNTWIMPCKGVNSCIFINFRGNTKATMIIEARQEWFEDYKDLNHAARLRCVAYQNIKDEYANLCKQIFDVTFPNIPIKKIEIGTPLTSADYLHSKEGCSYGISHSVERFSDVDVWRKLRPKTEISGLYLSGQDNLTAGAAGAFLSGLMTAAIHLGWYFLFKESMLGCFKIARHHS